MKMSKPVVTTTPKGKVSLRLSKSIKPHVLSLLEAFLAGLSESATGRLTLASNQDRVNRMLVEEVFVRYYTQLSIIDRESTMLLTRAQAHVIWGLCQRYPAHPSYFSAEVGNLLMQLHKTLL